MQLEGNVSGNICGVSIRGSSPAHKADLRIRNQPLRHRDCLEIQHQAGLRWTGLFVLATAGISNVRAQGKQIPRLTGNE